MQPGFGQPLGLGLRFASFPEDLATLESKRGGEGSDANADGESHDDAANAFGAEESERDGTGRGDAGDAVAPVDDALGRRPVGICARSVHGESIGNFVMRVNLGSTSEAA